MAAKHDIPELEGGTVAPCGHAASSVAEAGLHSELALVWSALDTVTDPEIPVVSIVDMGIVAKVSLDDGHVIVEMTPTFAGCPALDVIRENIRHAVRAAGFENVRVDVVFDPPWTSDRITPEGRRKLKSFGLAPPACDAREGFVAAVPCPHCDSPDTTLESLFGPTLCRAIHYCNACRQSFEQFKPL
jgi:ring-1,2-phenylacetyl-CoA epoxidase subunit PaaD